MKTSLLQGFLFDFISLGKHLLGSAKIYIGWGEIIQRLVIGLVVGLKTQRAAGQPALSGRADAEENRKATGRRIDVAGKIDSIPTVPCDENDINVGTQTRKKGKAAEQGFEQVILAMSPGINNSRKASHYQRMGLL